jgi:hypothetical protein
MMQMVRIEPRIAAEQSYWLRFFGRCGSMGGSRNAQWNSRRAEAPAAALRAVEALDSRLAEALTAATTLQREEFVAVMAAQTAGAASGPEKAIWRRARAGSPVLAVLTAQKAEPLRGRAAEIFAEHFAERLPRLSDYRMRPTRLADFATGV